ncbi:MAG: archaeosortase H N-terminal-like domain-containing protein [Promethearchaeota archaeon]
MQQLFIKKLIFWILLSLNVLFAFIIGLTISSMTSESSPFLGIIVIPLLVILNYIYLDRFHFWLRTTPKEDKKSNKTSK